MSDDFRDMLSIDRVIHEPARLIIVAILYSAESVDFLYLLRETALTKGNLSSHLAKLEKSEYIEVEKVIHGKTTRTTYSLTDAGRAAFEEYYRRLKHAVDSMV